MKPIIILPKGAMTPEHISLLNENMLCVVECDDPHAVKFVDPIPSAEQRSKIETAAIQLSRKLLNWQVRDSNLGQISRDNIAKLYVELLLQGTPLRPGQTVEEEAEEERRFARVEESRKIGREEARAEAARKKAEKEAAKKK